MSTFNHRHLKKQELLAKEDIDILLEALDTSKHVNKIHSEERLEFLIAKLKRMKKS